MRFHEQEGQHIHMKSPSQCQGSQASNGSEARNVQGKWLEFKKKWKTVVAFDRNTERSHRKNKTTFYLVIESGGRVHEYKVKAKDKERN